MVSRPTLKNYPSIMCKHDLKEAAKLWIELLEKNKNIYPTDKAFDYDNQLDNFQNSYGNYDEVIAWIRWFFAIDQEESIS